MVEWVGVLNMKSHKDLDIFQISKTLAIQVHSITLALPKFEMYEEGSQLRRSSKSIPTNIAEGFARRRYKADYIKYLVYAQAECDETLLHLELLRDTKSIVSPESVEPIMAEYDSLGRRINKFIQWTEDNWKP